MDTTWDGSAIADDDPRGCVVVVRRHPSGRDTELLVLHRAVNGPDYEGNWAWTAPAGARHPGEPVLTAALRELAEEAGITGADVWAVDLSGRWALFATDVAAELAVDLVDPEHDRFEWLDADTARRRILPIDVARAQVDRAGAVGPVSLGFRPMTPADFPDVVAWQARPHVARWWSSEATTVEGARAHYGPALDGTDPTRMWVLEINGRSAGMLQDYRVGDHPDWAVLTARPDAIGFDYLIGEPAWVDQRIGTRMLWTFLRDVVRPGYPEATEFFAAPDHRNERSLRVLDKLGFRRGLWFDEPQADGTTATVVGCTLDVRRILGSAPVTRR